MMVQVWAAYSPVKNAPEDARAKVASGSPSHSATTGELDIYYANCRHDLTFPVCEKGCPVEGVWFLGVVRLTSGFGLVKAC